MQTFSNVFLRKLSWFDKHNQQLARPAHKHLPVALQTLLLKQHSFKFILCEECTLVRQRGDIKIWRGGGNRISGYWMSRSALLNLFKWEIFSLTTKQFFWDGSQSPVKSVFLQRWVISIYQSPQHARYLRLTLIILWGIDNLHTWMVAARCVWQIWMKK